MTTKLYLLSKKLHRILVLIIAMMTIIMGGTGVLMKYEFITEKVGFINEGFIKYIHSSLSIYFVIVLGLMMLTGLYMYFFPVLRKK